MSTITHDRLVAGEEAPAISLTDWGLLLLRLALGVVFIAHGSQKLFGWFGGQGLAATIQGFEKGGIPAPLAYLVPFTEFLGGLGLIFGVLARLSAIGISVIMLVAIFKVHLANGFFMNWMGKQPGEGFEYHLLVLGMAATVLLAGPGRLALADWEGRFLRRGAIEAGR
jgi:putative oxidoreductase